MGVSTYSAISSASLSLANNADSPSAVSPTVAGAPAICHTLSTAAMSSLVALRIVRALIKKTNTIAGGFKRQRATADNRARPELGGTLLRARSEIAGFPQPP